MTTQQQKIPQFPVAQELQNADSAVFVQQLVAYLIYSQEHGDTTLGFVVQLPPDSSTYVAVNTIQTLKKFNCDEIRGVNYLIDKQQWVLLRQHDVPAAVIKNTKIHSRQLAAYLFFSLLHETDTQTRNSSAPGNAAEKLNQFSGAVSGRRFSDVRHGIVDIPLDNDGILGYQYPSKSLR
jgi:hypothetical protein